MIALLEFKTNFFVLFAMIIILMFFFSILFNLEKNKLLKNVKQAMWTTTPKHHQHHPLQKQTTPTMIALRKYEKSVVTTKRLRILFCNCREHRHVQRSKKLNLWIYNQQQHYFLQVAKKKKKYCCSMSVNNNLCRYRRQSNNCIN